MTLPGRQTALSKTVDSSDLVNSFGVLLDYSNIGVHPSETFVWPLLRLELANL